MLKDIFGGSNHTVGVAVVKELNDSLQEVWNAYLVNPGDAGIENALVNCKGYGELNAVLHETAVTRYFLGDIPARSLAKIEPLDPALFALNNEYFITFYENGNMVDKKIVFAAHSLHEELLGDLELIGKRGLFLT